MNSHTVLLQTILFLTIQFISARNIDDYERNRTKLLEQESTYSLGGTLKLSEEEIAVNKILMKLKAEEANRLSLNSENFNFSRHYFTYRDHIETSKVYQIIKRMPKGGALHIHSTFVLDEDYLLNMTYEDHLYACYRGDDLKLLFSDVVPKQPCAYNWTLLSELRNASDNITSFDEQLNKHFTFFTKDDDYCYVDVNKAWEKFDKIHALSRPLFTYRPLRERYIYDTLKKFYDDNVMYIEMRSGMNRLYELNGTFHDPAYLVATYREITERFIENYPDFIGMKLILSKNRAAAFDAIVRAINTTRQIKKQFPEMIAGFDLVGREDTEKPLRDFLPQLLQAKDDLNFYFHAGETNWFGTTSDENLIDAILLGTKRIGHGYALTKHPVLMDIMFKEDIAVEVNVISNAVLALVGDVRNHPLANFLSLGLPVVLSSDDPGLWGAEPLSHDFYVSFVAIASKRDDIRLLKQLAINSIRYSALENKRKVRFFKVFNKRWRQFLRDIIEEYKHLQ